VSIAASLNLGLIHAIGICIFCKEEVISLFVINGANNVFITHYFPSYCDDFELLKRLFLSVSQRRQYAACRILCPAFI
jgi:hypothetical protein